MYVIKFPKEMKELAKIFTPYLDEMGRLKKDAPEKAVIAHKEYIKIADEFWEND